MNEPSTIYCVPPAEDEGWPANDAQRHVAAAMRGLAPGVLMAIDRSGLNLTARLLAKWLVQCTLLRGRNFVYAPALRFIAGPLRFSDSEISDILRGRRRQTGSGLNYSPPPANGASRDVPGLEESGFVRRRQAGPDGGWLLVVQPEWRRWDVKWMYGEDVLARWVRDMDVLAGEFGRRLGLREIDDWFPDLEQVLAEVSTIEALKQSADYADGRRLHQPGRQGAGANRDLSEGLAESNARLDAPVALRGGKVMPTVTSGGGWHSKVEKCDPKPVARDAHVVDAAGSTREPIIEKSIGASGVDSFFYDRKRDARSVRSADVAGAVTLPGSALPKQKHWQSGGGFGIAEAPIDDSSKDKRLLISLKHWNAFSMAEKKAALAELEVTRSNDRVRVLLGVIMGEDELPRNGGKWIAARMRDRTGVQRVMVSLVERMGLVHLPKLRSAGGMAHRYGDQYGIFLKESLNKPIKAR